MSTIYLTSFALLFVVASFIASATDPNQLDDFCVAINDPHKAVLMNGKLCKNPSEVTADDFFFRGLNESANTTNPLGSGFTIVDSSVLPGLNTLGISVVRVDYSASGGLVPPHYHSWGTKVNIVLEGTLYAGFVSFNQTDNTAKLYSKVIYPGDVFVLPQGLVHFLHNIGDTNAVVFVAMSSQNPGFTRVSAAVFETQLPISAELLSKAFKLDVDIVKDLQSKR